LLGRAYRWLLSRVIHRTFGFWQALGFHVSLDHYGEPMPNTSRLPEGTWSALSELPGLDMLEAEQLELLTLFESRFKEEYASLPRGRQPDPDVYYVDNPKFGAVDGEILYCMIRHLKPRRFLEMGSGYSTLLAAQASAKNLAEDASLTAELVANDPHPSRLVERLPSFVRLEKRRAQDVPLSEFESLGGNDILFIDSTHVLKIGSDVQYEILEVLPRLAEGVVVHVHDVFFPAEYPRSWVKRSHWFFNEQYFVRAFLAFNEAFEVLWASNYMSLRHPDRLAEAVPSYERGGMPGSLWMRRKTS
jgi:predicted O-methyltransferase YrrM